MASLADATRLRLLALLAAQELGVCDLCEVVRLPQSTVSRHLKILADDGWVTSRRQGTTNFYQMFPDTIETAQRELWELAHNQSEQWATLGQDAVRLNHLVKTREQDAGAFFEGAAGDWDQIRHELYGSAFTQHAMLGLLPADWIVADLGCGSGALTRALASRVSQVIGVDNSAAMLKAARKLTRGCKNTDLRRGELADLPIDDEECDAAICVLVLTYLEDPAAAISEMARVVESGGRVVIVDLLAHDREAFRRQMGQTHAGFEPGALKRMLAKSGLKDVRCEALPPEPEATGPALLLATGVRP